MLVSVKRIAAETLGPGKNGPDEVEDRGEPHRYLASFLSCQPHLRS
jgi:hypothetical protein